MILRKCVELFNTNTTIHALHNVIADYDDVNDEEEVYSCAPRLNTLRHILNGKYCQYHIYAPRAHACIEKRK